MPRRKSGWVERDRHGREYVVMGSRHRRASSHGASTRELLNQAEERVDVLNIENQELRRQLSISHAQQWELRDLQVDHVRLVDEHQGCRKLRGQLEARRREIAHLQAQLDARDYQNERLEDRIRLLKRTNHDRDQYRQRYEDKSAEAEHLRTKLWNSEARANIGETRNYNKDRAVEYLRARLGELGYRYDLSSYGY